MAPVARSASAGGLYVGTCAHAEGGPAEGGPTQGSRHGHVECTAGAPLPRWAESPSAGLLALYLISVDHGQAASRGVHGRSGKFVETPRVVKYPRPGHRMLVSLRAVGGRQ